MAGTRLKVHGWYLVQFLALVGWAAVVGQYRRDVVLRKRWQLYYRDAVEDLKRRIGRHLLPSSLRRRIVPIAWKRGDDYVHDGDEDLLTERQRLQDIRIGGVLSAFSPTITLVCKDDDDAVAYWQSLARKLNESLTNWKHNSSNEKEVGNERARPPSTVVVAVRAATSRDRLDERCYMDRSILQQEAYPEEEEPEFPDGSDSLTVWICDRTTSSSKTTTADGEASRRLLLRDVPDFVVGNRGRTTMLQHVGDADRSLRALQKLLFLLVPSASDDGGDRASPPPPPLQRMLRFRLWVPPSSPPARASDDEQVIVDWKIAANSLNEHLQRHRSKGIGYDNWPCLLSSSSSRVVLPRVDVRYWNDADALLGEPIAATSADPATNKTTTTTYYDVDVRSSDNKGLSKIWSVGEEEEDPVVNLLLSPNRQHPIRFTDPSTRGSSAIMQRGNSYVLALDPNGNDGSGAFDAQLVPVMRRVWGRCMGAKNGDFFFVDDNDPPFIRYDDDDEDGRVGSFPAIVQRLWHRRAVTARYADVVERFIEYHDREKERRYEFLVSTDFESSDWKESVASHLRDAYRYASQEKFRQAMQSIDAADALLRHYSNPLLFIDMPVEQYAAIFAPLIMPLALPLLLGMIREIRRYRQLVYAKNKKNEGEDNNKNKKQPILRRTTSLGGIQQPCCIS